MTAGNRKIISLACLENDSFPSSHIQPQVVACKKKEKRRGLCVLLTCKYRDYTQQMTEKFHMKSVAEVK